MPKYFKILFIPCALIGMASGQLSDKEKLCMEVLETADSYSGIEPIIHIAERYGHIYTYIPSVCPISKKNNPVYTSQYGYRIHPQTGKRHFHTGLDITADYATTIHTTASGEVVFAGSRGGYGKCIIIEHRYGFSTLYGHLTEYYTEEGKKVQKGDIIGFLGDTGNSTAEHLHYEIRKNNHTLNPIDFIN